MSDNSIWQQCNGETQITELFGTLYRLVEDQIHPVTLDFVDTMEEQELLEQLLEQVKPPNPIDDPKLHYLLKTPFRYPPLKWGSRFGRAYEPSLFYGAKDVETVLAESAYYRLIFWHSMSMTHLAISRPRYLRTKHCLFSVDYHVERGIRLNLPPFSEFQSILTHPKDYAQTQVLGSHMREADVEGFEYRSARLDDEHNLCVALFTPKGFVQHKPKETTQWLCQVDDAAVSFKAPGEHKFFRFELADMLYDGQLPLPA